MLLPLFFTFFCSSLVFQTVNSYYACCIDKNWHGILTKVFDSTYTAFTYRMSAKLKISIAITCNVLVSFSQKLRYWSFNKGRSTSNRAVPRINTCVHFFPLAVCSGLEFYTFQDQINVIWLTYSPYVLNFDLPTFSQTFCNSQSIIEQA
jgi:hypothetical protein